MSRRRLLFCRGAMLIAARRQLSIRPAGDRKHCEAGLTSRSWVHGDHSRVEDQCLSIR
jgi:hypothetical protein